MRFVAGTPLEGDAVKLTLLAVPFVLIGGFMIAGICGYMAGLIGASNSPISGVGILSIVTFATILVAAAAPSPGTSSALVAFALFVTAIVFACATISNDNLQDLKTGQLVGASPMRQQIALIVGVAAGAAVIPPVLNLLARAYGFAGAANVNVVAANPLPAPQATLISALAQGVIGGNLDWKMIGIGAIVGLVIIGIDETLQKNSAFPRWRSALASTCRCPRLLPWCSAQSWGTGTKNRRLACGTRIARNVSACSWRRA
jgi:putative OPT family oligopeptide transporter